MRVQIMFFSVIVVTVLCLLVRDTHSVRLTAQDILNSSSPDKVVYELDTHIAINESVTWKGRENTVRCLGMGTLTFRR